MIGEAGVPRQSSREIEQLSAERARERANASRWAPSLVVASYAVLIVVMLLGFKDVSIEIVAPVAILGLAAIWFMVRIRGKQLYKRFYVEELRQLQEFSGGEEAKVFITSPLTRRETEILSYVACGNANKQIADKLGVNEQTIKNHMRSILLRLDASDRTQAVVLALHNKWISQNKEGLSHQFD